MRVTGEKILGSGEFRTGVLRQRSFPQPYKVRPLLAFSQILQLLAQVFETSH
jgi:hypothetical protein